MMNTSKNKNRDVNRSNLMTDLVKARLNAFLLQEACEYLSTTNKALLELHSKHQMIGLQSLHQLLHRLIQIVEKTTKNSVKLFLVASRKSSDINMIASQEMRILKRVFSTGEIYNSEYSEKSQHVDRSIIDTFVQIRKFSSESESAISQYENSLLGYEEEMNHQMVEDYESMLCEKVKGTILHDIETDCSDHIIQAISDKLSPRICRVF